MALRRRHGQWTLTVLVFIVWHSPILVCTLLRGRALDCWRPVTIVQDL